MRIFVFPRLDQVSGSYHSGGGLVIVAEDIHHARQLVESDKDIRLSETEWRSAEVFDLAGSPKPRFWVMEDAGCC